MHGLKRENQWWKIFDPLYYEPALEYLGVTTQRASPLYK